MTCLATTTQQDGWSSLGRDTAGHMWQVWDDPKLCTGLWKKGINQGRLLGSQLIPSFAS